MSHENVEAVVEYAQTHMSLVTDSSEWVETTRDEEKGPYGEMYDHITYKHVNGMELHAVSHVDDGDEWAVIEGGDLLYDIQHDTSVRHGSPEYYALFCPKDFWERNHYIIADVEHDHQSALLMLVHGMPQALADNEAMEGLFSLPVRITSMADAHDYLQNLGYTYRDMTVQNQTSKQQAQGPVATNASDAKVIDVLQPVIDLFEANDPTTLGGDFFIGNHLAEQLDKYEDTAHFLDPLVTEVLERSGIPDPLNSVYAESDRSELLKRLKKAADSPVSRLSAGKALAAVNEHNQRASEEPVDLHGMNMGEVYRLAIRGKIPQIAAIGWAWCDGKGHGTEDELAWYCGYVDFDGHLMRDLHIPDHVFEGWFPEYRKATFNDYEKEGASNYHTMPLPDEPYVEGVRAIIASRYADRGVTSVPDMALAAIVPLNVVGSSVAKRVVQSTSYVPSSNSNVVTLKAYPPGHTGVAAAITPTSAAAASSATQARVEGSPGVNTATETKNMWREYQVNMNALAEHGIARAGYQVVKTTPHMVLALGFLDEAGGIVGAIPQEEILKMFAEYTISCLDDGVTYRINKLFGQELGELEKTVHERLQGAKVFDVTE